MPGAPEEIHAVCSRLTQQRPTAAELPFFIEAMLQQPCPDLGPGIDSPAEVARELWTGKRSVLLAAGRDSFKTLTVAGVEFLLAHFDGMQILHFGAYERQAKQTIEYLQVMGSLPWWGTHVLVGTMQARFRSGGSIRCAPLTLASARSAHVPFVAFDEADECRPDARKVAVNIASSRRDQPARTIDLSTKNRPKGPMANMIANAPRSGHRVIQYNYLAVTERCTDERSGTGTAEVWIHRKYLQARVDDPEGDPEGWENILVRDRCPACPLVATCRGELKKSAGVLPISDLIRAFTDAAMTALEWRSQRENVDPSLEGIAVPEWDEDRCVSEDAVYDKALPVICAQDFGISHLAVTLLGQRIPAGYAPLLADGTRGPPNPVQGRARIIDEYVTHSAFEPGVISWLAANWFDDRYRWPSRFMIDPSGAPMLERIKVNLPNGKTRTLVLRKANTKWEPGIRALRGYCEPQIDGVAKLLVHPRCEQLREEMATVRTAKRPDGSYIMRKDTVTGGDDAQDTARYLIMELRGGRIESPQDQAEALERILHGGFG